MDVASTIVIGVIVTVVGGLLAFLIVDRFRQVDARLDRLEAKVDRHDERFDRMDERFDVLRSDLTAIALAVGAKPRASRG